MHQEAQWKVGLLCERSMGADFSEAGADHCFMLAANSGYREEQVKAREYYMNGKGIQRDLHTADQILQPSTKNGNEKVKHLNLLKLQLFLRHN